MNKNLLEIRFHGRAGQGAKSSAQLVAEAVVKDGKHLQVFAEYGPERSGAPVKTFARVSYNPILTHEPIIHPDIVVILDSTLLESDDSIFEGVNENTILVINAVKIPKSISNYFKGTVYVLDATRIAMEKFGKDIPNTVMLGVLLRATDKINKELISRAIEEMFGDKLGTELAKANIDALEEGFKKAKRIQLNGNKKREQKVKYKSWKEIPIGGMIIKPGSSREYLTGSWKTENPIWDRNRCKQCFTCVINCPENAMRVKDNKMMGIDFDYCKGCGICANVCPVKAIAMKRKKL